MPNVIVGVDEAGRGPLAGPVAVGIVRAPQSFDIKQHFPGVADSKKLSEEKRETIYALLLERTNNGDVQFSVQFSEAAIIDSIGITKAVKEALDRGVRLLVPHSEGVKVLLDGLLHAPEEYAQETIIRGDQSEPIISLASIAAKVERDGLMKNLAAQFPDYGFDIHKGYGTKKHREAITTFGFCNIHRKTFCS